MERKKGSVRIAIHHGFRRGSRRVLAGGLCALLVVCAFFGSFVLQERKASANVALSGTYDYSMAYRVQQMVNAERKARGLNELVFDGRFQARSDLRSSEANVTWSHTRPNGQDWSSLFLTDAAPGATLGENLAWNTGYEDPGGNAVIQWLESPGHYENMMNPKYVTTSVSVFIGTDGYYFAQIFSSEPFSGTPPITSGQQSVTLSIDDGTSVPIPTNTPIPTDTPVPTQGPTNTPTPVAVLPPPTVAPERPGPPSPTAAPTGTPVPTATSTPVPTFTATPSPSPTPVPKVDTPTPTPAGASSQEPTRSAASPTPSQSVSPTGGAEAETGVEGSEEGSTEESSEAETGEEETTPEETGEEETGEEPGGKEAPHVEGIRFLVEESDRVLKVGDAYELKIEVAPKGADLSEVVYYSSDSEVALMEGNVIHAVGEGTTTIHAQAGGVDSSIQFRVSDSGDVGNIVREGTLKPETGDQKAGSILFSPGLTEVFTSEFADVILRVKLKTDGPIGENDRLILEVADATGRFYQIPLSLSALTGKTKLDPGKGSFEEESESGSGEAESGSESEHASESESGSETGEGLSEPETAEVTDLSGGEIELSLSSKQLLRLIEEQTGRSLKNVVLRSGELRAASDGGNTIVLVEVNYNYSIAEEAYKRIQDQKEAADKEEKSEDSAAVVNTDTFDQYVDESYTKTLGGIIIALSVILFIFVIMFLILLVKSVFGTEETPQNVDESHYGRRSGDTPRRFGRSGRKGEARSTDSGKSGKASKKTKGKGSAEGSKGLDETTDLSSELSTDLSSAKNGQGRDHGTHSAEAAGVSHEPEPMSGNQNLHRRSSDRK